MRKRSGLADEIRSLTVAALTGQTLIKHAFSSNLLKTLSAITVSVHYGSDRNRWISCIKRSP